MLGPSLMSPRLLLCRLLRWPSSAIGPLHLATCRLRQLSSSVLHVMPSWLRSTEGQEGVQDDTPCDYVGVVVCAALQCKFGGLLNHRQQGGSLLLTVCQASATCCCQRRPAICAAGNEATGLVVRRTAACALHGAQVVMLYAVCNRAQRAVHSCIRGVHACNRAGVAAL